MVGNRILRYMLNAKNIIILEKKRKKEQFINLVFILYVGSYIGTIYLFTVKLLILVLSNPLKIYRIYL